MRIGIDARFISDHFPGIGRYVYHLVLALASLPHDHELVLLHNPDIPNTRHDMGALLSAPSLTCLPITARPFSWGEHVQLPALARTLRLDLLHSPYYIKPYAGLPCPSVVTIYDLIGRRFPQVLPRKGRIVFNLATWLALHTAQHIITISHSARDDVVQDYHIPAERIAVTHLAADERFCPQPPDVVAAVRAKYAIPRRYTLYLGANKPHKNLERLVLAWAQLATEQAGAHGNHLVLAGHQDPRYPQARHLVQQLGIGDTVTFLPNVDDADLPALYSGAELFVFPSYYEGFGLPPLEAMACGTPVLCANTSSLPEVVGNAALLVDPFRVDDIAGGLTRLLLNPPLRAELREKGFRQAKTFSWERTAQATLAVYEAVASRYRS